MSNYTRCCQCDGDADTDSVICLKCEKANDEKVNRRIAKLKAALKEYEGWSPHQFLGLHEKYRELQESYKELDTQRYNAEIALTEERALLDGLQAMTKGYGRGWICRNSTTGRGMRLHETSQPDAKPTVREALRAAIDAAREKRP